MSDENIKRLQRAIEAVAEEDKSSWIELVDPDVEWIPVSDWPETSPVRGRDAVWDFMVAANEPWEPGAYEFSEAVDRGDKLVVRLQRDLRGKSSGMEVKYDYWLVMAFRDDKATRFEFFADRPSALNAAGISEEPGAPAGRREDGP